MTNHTRRSAPRVARLAAVLAALLAALPTGLSAAQADPLVPTTTTLVVSGGGTFGDPTTLTATVASPGSTPTGTVTFSVGSDDLTTDIPVDPSGLATATVPEPRIGPFEITATFHGTGGFADSSGSTFYFGNRATVVLDPEPTVLRVSPLKLTLTMSATARRTDGRPIAGEPLTFSVFGAQPNLFDFGGGTVVCTAVTDAHGFASCRGAGTLGAVASILAGGSYVTHFRFGYYDFTSVKAPVLLAGGV